MFAGNTNLLPYIRNYAEAHAHWEKTKLPSRSKKWAPHQRPLKNTQSPHYRLEKGDGYYDVCLYTTVMARFFEPASIGERRCYMGDNSQTSKKFMWDVLGVQAFKHFDTTDGRKVVAPITGKRMPDSDFSADLMFVDGKLDVGMSQHTPIYRTVSSAQDKAERKHVKQAMDSLLTLCAMRMPELERTVQADFAVAGAFFSAKRRYDEERAVRVMVQDFLLNEPPAQENVAKFMRIADNVYQKIASDRAYALQLISWHNSTCPVTDLPDDKRVTEKEFMASLWRIVQKLGRLTSRSGTTPYPQFPEEVVLTYSNVVTYKK